jgi:hypothetical protein
VLFVRPMTGEAIIGKNGANLAIKIYSRSGL